jgi:hypothetical protein
MPPPALATFPQSIFFKVRAAGAAPDPACVAVNCYQI